VADRFAVYQDEAVICFDRRGLIIETLEARNPEEL
jgi:hypothetical protein